MRLRAAIPLLALAIAPSRASAFDQPVDRVIDASAGVAALRAEGPAELLLRGGTFTMGSDVPEVLAAFEACAREPERERCREDMFADELVAHPVVVSDFWIDRTEVTSRAYRRCIEAGACPPFAHEGASAWAAHDDEPVTLVTWSEAAGYCRWLGKRLPTEAEWERAARGLTGRRFAWGEVFNPRICNHGRFAIDTSALDADDGFAELAPVGSFPQGRTSEGVEDLAGNAEEWVADWYAPGYPAGRQVDPPGPESGDFKVVRGGSFQAGAAWLRGAARGRDLPSVRRAWRGFRCARSAG